MDFKNKVTNLFKHVTNSYLYLNYNKKIDERIVYCESRDGNDFTGNVLRIIEELSRGDYGKLKIYVRADDDEVKSKIKYFKKKYNLKIHKIISGRTRSIKLLEKAKYIITDSGMPSKYIKRPDQILLNTWHGVPLKKMGADNVSEEHTIGVTQHALLSSDYLLYPSQYMCEKMLNAYKIKDIYSGKVLMEGYPRNDVFFDENQRNKVKSELNLDGKEVLVYMPTYNGSYHDLQNKKQINDLKRFFKKLDTQLNDNQVLLVKLHHFNDNDFDLSNYNHIDDFPSDYETYDVLNTADVLITDYSSVLFDFACTGRKIILFNYDESEYMKYRGIYINLSDLPFPKVQNVDGLVREINSAKDYDDNEFINEYCTYNNAESTKRICRHIFNDEKVCVEKELKSDKRNILIYGGPLLIGRLDFLNNLISKIDLKKNNVFVSYPQWNSYIRNSHRDIFTRLPEEVKFVPFFSGISFTVREQIKYHKFLNSEYNPSLIYSMEKAFKREIDKLYYNFPYDAVINIDGIHSEQAILFSFCDCKTTVFVHNDMVREIKNKDKFNKNVYKYAYDHYDTVVVVSDDLIKPTSKLTSKTENIKVIHNLNDYDESFQNQMMKLRLMTRQACF